MQFEEMSVGCSFKEHRGKTPRRLPAILIRMIPPVYTLEQ